MSNSAPSDTDSATPSFEAEAESSIEDSELAAQIDILVSENKRLRRLLAERQRSRYRQTAIALIGIGIVCGAVGTLVSEAAPVLFALAGTGVFGGVLTYFLTPERFITADIGQRVYEATAQSFDRICADLGLSDRRIYLPVAPDDRNVSKNNSWLFVPQSEETTIPTAAAIDSAFVVEDESRGLTVQPTGSELFTTFEESLVEPLGDSPEALCAQLSDALVEDFELAKSIEYETAPDEGRVSMRFSEILYGNATQFDHPIVSVVAVGLATGLQIPIETTITDTDPLAVTFRWDQSEGN